MFLTNLISKTKQQLSLLRSLLTVDRSEVSNYCQGRINMVTTTKTVTATIATNKPETCYQSRWGWHPISFDAFCKLKKIHKLVWNAWYAHKHFGRWLRKTVHQPAEQPPYDHRFTKEKKGIGYYACMLTHYKRDSEVATTDGLPEYEELYTSTVLYGEKTDYYFDPIASDVIVTMRMARTPKENEADVTKPPLSEEKIHELHAQFFPISPLDS